MKIGIIYALLFGLTFAAPTEDECLVNITDGNFDDLVKSSDEIWFIKFFAPWCGHCKRLHPIWVDLAIKSCKSNVHIAQANW